MMDLSLFVKLSGCVCALLTAGKGHWAGGGEGGGYKNKPRNLKNTKFQYHVTSCQNNYKLYPHPFIFIFVIKGPQPSEFWPR